MIVNSRQYLQQYSIQYKMLLLSIIITGFILLQVLFLYTRLYSTVRPISREVALIGALIVVVMGASVYLLLWVLFATYQYGKN